MRDTKNTDGHIYPCIINGEFVSPEGRKLIEITSPTDGTLIAKIYACTTQEIDQAVCAARNAVDGGAWSKLAAFERGRLMHKVYELINENADELAILEAKDTGKPLTQAKADMVAAARYFEYYGAAADKVHGDTIPYLPGYNVQTIHEPFGVTGHIIPWNYPAQMTGRSIAAALAMGNAIVLKPAEEACLTPLKIVELCIEAGFPAGAVNIVTGYGHEAGAALTAHKGVNFLSFTGSPEVGVLIQKSAAENHIPCTLELGGKSPQIIFDDADLEACLPFLMKGIIQNGGQTCSAGSRALIQKNIFDEVVNRLKVDFAELTAAPWTEDRDLGSLISQTQKKRVEKFINAGGTDKAPLITRGKISDTAPADGAYVAPALFGPVDENHILAKEEVFGPVLSCIPFENEDDAIRIANDTDYGLMASVWTIDGQRHMRMAKRLKAGQVYLNAFGAGSGVELPFGGSGKSGHGREKGFEALYEFSQVKTIILNHG